MLKQFKEHDDGRAALHAEAAPHLDALASVQRDVERLAGELTELVDQDSAATGAARLELMRQKQQKTAPSRLRRPLQRRWRACLEFAFVECAPPVGDPLAGPQPAAREAQAQAGRHLRQS